MLTRLGGSNNFCFHLPFAMVRLRTYGPLTAAPGGRSFYSAPRKRVRKRAAPLTSALKTVLAKRREERLQRYYSALEDARHSVEQHAKQLREEFGAHSVDYYHQEILQRGRLERGRRKATRWNAFMRHELKKRNDGTSRYVMLSLIPKLTLNPKSCQVVSRSSSLTKLHKRSPQHGTQ
jgi:hypothetical protein